MITIPTYLTKPTVEHLHLMALQHVRRYESMIAESKRGAAGVRVLECREYIDQWQSVVSAIGRAGDGATFDHVWALLGNAAQNEIVDALWDEQQPSIKDDL